MTHGPPKRSAALDGVCLREVVGPGVAPGVVVAAAGVQGGAFHYRVGCAGVRSVLRPTPIDAGTPYDLASVTKPIVACTAARLVRARRLSWDLVLGDCVPELSDTPAGRRSLELLLSHRSGLSAHGALFLPLLSGERVDRAAALVQAASWMRPECVGPPPPEGHPPVYSDLGYLLAGELMSRATALPLEALVWDEVCEPLALEIADAETLGARDPAFLERVAPTETVGFRGGEIVGAVHDENAWALSGLGLSGHAGLFGTALDVARFGAALLDALAGRSSSWLGPDDVEHLVRPRPGGTLRAGFDGRAAEGSSAGSRFGPRSFGHLGFTGTSLWCDPDADAVAVILTNRVSPSRDSVKIRAARPVINDALHRLSTSLGSGGADEAGGGEGEGGG